MKSLFLRLLLAAALALGGVACHKESDDLTQAQIEAKAAKGSKKGKKNKTKKDGTKKEKKTKDITPAPTLTKPMP